MLGNGSDSDAPALQAAVLAPYFPPEYTGAGIQLANLLEWLEREGIAITVLTARQAFLTAGRATEPAVGGQVRLRRFRTPESGLWRELVLGLRAGAWLLLDRRWRILHLIDFSFVSVLPMLVARLLGRPVLVKTTLLDDDGRNSLGARLFRRVRHWGYGRCDAVVALSDALEEQLRRQYGVATGIVRIPNGVDTRKFHPVSEAERVSLRSKLGLSESIFLILSCGMLMERKNPLALVEAVARMHRRPIYLVLAGPRSGEGEYERRLDQAIEALPEGIEVELPGDLDSARVAEWLSAADVYALTSRAEGMPNSVLEAMASGLACVATDIPGSRDLLADGGGVLVPLDDVEALATVLDRLSDHPEERRALGAEALRRVERQYSMARVTERYLDVYRCLNEGRPAGT